MFRPSEHNQIARRVVGLVTIDVVDSLTRSERAANLLHGDDCVFMDVPGRPRGRVIGQEHLDVPLPVHETPAFPIPVPFAAVCRALASLGAVLPAVRMRRRCVERVPTPLAGLLDAFPVNGPFTAKPAATARVGTEPTPFVGDRPLDAEWSLALVAGQLNQRGLFPCLMRAARGTVAAALADLRGGRRERRLAPITGQLNPHNGSSFFSVRSRTSTMKLLETL